MTDKQGTTGARTKPTCTTITNDAFGLSETHSVPGLALPLDILKDLRNNVDVRCAIDLQFYRDGKRHRWHAKLTTQGSEAHIPRT